MSIKSSNKIDTNKFELEIEVDAVAFEEAVQSAYFKARKNISVPGFRKGKAPRKMIEKLYGEGTFYEDAVNALIPVETSKAIDEQRLEIIDRPEIEVISVNKENGLLFKAVCVVKPDVEVTNYKGIEVQKVVNAVTDEDVDAQIQKMREKNSRLITIEDRPAQNGDDVVIDFEGFINDIAFEGGKADKFTLSLGSGQFIGGFEDQVVGHSIGEEFDINVTFPEDYQMKEIAGKPAVFKIKLHEIKARELPELDDDFVKDTTEFETLETLKEDIKTKMCENSKKQSEADVENKIYEAVIANTVGEIPQIMFDKRVEAMVQEFAQHLNSQGMNLDIYLQYTGMTMDAFKKTYEDRAKNEVKLRLALEKIAQLENIEVSDAELDEEFNKFVEAYEIELEKIKGMISSDELKKDILVKKAADLVRNETKISE